MNLTRNNLLMIRMRFDNHISDGKTPAPGRSWESDPPLSLAFVRLSPRRQAHVYDSSHHLPQVSPWSHLLSSEELQTTLIASYLRWLCSKKPRGQRIKKQQNQMCNLEILVQNRLKRGDVKLGARRKIRKTSRRQVTRAGAEALT